MTETKFKEIKDKIKSLDEKRNKAQGVIESALKNLKDKYKLSSIEEANTKVEELKKDSELYTSKLSKLETRLEESYQWDSV
jgi:chromosome segregation ATPase